MDGGAHADPPRLEPGAGLDGRGPLGALCRRVEPPLHAYVRARVGARLARWVDPADIVQAVLLEVVGAAGATRAPVDEDTLLRRLLRTARNRIRDEARRHARRAGETAMPARLEDLARDVSSTGAVSRADQERWLRALVERLPDKYRDVVRLCALEGLDHAAAAARLGLRPDAVRMRYERARRLLQERLASRRHG